MKTIKLLSILFISTLIFTSCSDDDNPDPVNEEEVISIVNLTFTNSADANDVVTLTWEDTDEDGTVDIHTNDKVFAANATYNASITLANQDELITPEIVDEDDEHQFFYSSGVATFSYSDQDGNGNPVGLSFSMTTAAATTGSLSVILKHEPTKPNNGTAAGADGSTDLDISFDVTVQ